MDAESGIFSPSPFLDGSVAQWASTETKHGKSRLFVEGVWGRKVIQSIDKDDCVTLGELIDERKVSGVNVNTQVDIQGFGGYLWTIAVHRHLGDTALHIAIRQRKLMCIYMLIYMRADVSIMNSDGVTPAQLLEELYKTNYHNMLYDAKRYIINTIDPMDIKRLPASFGCLKAEEEAWQLIHSGRILYKELPKVLRSKEVNPHIISSKARKRLSFNESYRKVPYSSRSKSIKMKPSLQEIMAKVSADNDQPWQQVEITLPNRDSKPSTGRRQDKSLASGGSGSLMSGSEDEEEEEEEERLPRPFVPRTFSLDSDEKLSEGGSLALSTEKDAGKALEDQAWEQQVSVEGQVFYYNTITGASSWDPPAHWQQQQQSQEELQDTLHGGTSFMESDSITSGDVSTKSYFAVRPKLMLDDVWTKNSLQDIIDLVERQKYNRDKMHVRASTGPVLYGLPLLSSVKAGNSLELLHDRENMLASGERQALAKVYQDYNQIEQQGVEALLKARGVKNLRFVNSSAMERAIASASQALDGASVGDESSLASLTVSRKQLTASHVISDKILFSAQNSPSRRFNAPGSMKSTNTNQSAALAASPYLESLYNSNLSSRTTGRAANQSIRAGINRASFASMGSTNTTARTQRHRPVFTPISSSVKLRTTAEPSSEHEGPTSPGMASNISMHDAAELQNLEPIYREITELSTLTNLKYLPIDNDGASRLAQALYLDPCIIKLTLSNAHIGDSGCIALADVIPSMKALVYLDLSGNCIGDAGMLALADGLMRSYNTANNSISNARNEQGRRANSLIATITTLSVVGNRGSLDGLVSLINCLTLQPQHHSQQQQQEQPWHRLYWLSIHNNALHREDLEVLTKILEEQDYLPRWPHDRDIPPRLAKKVTDSFDLHRNWPADCIVMTQALDATSQVLYQHWISLADSESKGNQEDDDEEGDDLGAGPSLSSAAKASSWMMSISRIGSQVITEVVDEESQESRAVRAGSVVIL